MSGRSEPAAKLQYGQSAEPCAERATRNTRDIAASYFEQIERTNRETQASSRARATKCNVFEKS